MQGGVVVRVALDDCPLEKPRRVLGVPVIVDVGIYVTKSSTGLALGKFEHRISC